MNHLSRRVFAAALLGAACATVYGCSGCARSGATNDAGPIEPLDGAGPAAFLTRRAPNAGSGFQRVPLPPSSVGLLPQPKREPDWDLSSDDDARDYARRYAFFTKRYGDNFACIDVGPSQPAGNQKSVEVKTAAGCPGAGTVRDVFLVDVAGDHLSVDDRSKRDPLARWPDGSDPEGPATTPVREIDRMQDWKSPLQDVVRKQLLVPVRVQAYGRGTYPVISLAGWHGAIQLDAPLDTLQPLAQALCAASGNMPLGIVTASDRTRILRIRCPASIRWDRL